jgi:SNF2 family DNA or RNA helicase
MPSSNSGIRDNHTRGTVADFLKSEIRDGSRLSVVSAYFTIYAYDALKDCLERIDHLDFLFGEPSFVDRLDPSKTQQKSFIIDADGLELANKLHQKHVAKECADWIERKVDIKTIKQSNLLHGKMYHVATAGVEEAILGSSNFTVRGLGLGNGYNNIELNLIVDGKRDRQDLKQWFDDLWNHPDLVKDVKQEVLQYLQQLYDNHAPEFIYYKTLFHIVEKFLDDTGKTDAELGRTSLFETDIWQALFEFQKDGVKGAINKILRHNGCIIADSVGLGKTYEALAVIKYFELKNERVLVLYPTSSAPTPIAPTSRFSTIFPLMRYTPSTASPTSSGCKPPGKRPSTPQRSTSASIKNSPIGISGVSPRPSSPKTRPRTPTVATRSASSASSPASSSAGS